MDLDNVSHGQKYVIDGLVHAGILPDDTRKTVISILHKFTPPDSKSPRVAIEIIKINEKSNETAGTLEKSQ
jgi:Holliday junction resolvase RusA-like endonuclease